MRRLFLLLALVRCSSDPEPAPEFPFDPNAVHEVKTRDRVVTDAPFATEVPTLFRTTDALPNLDVTSLAYEGDTLYAGTVGGLVKRTGAIFAAVATLGPGGVRDLAVKAGELAALYDHAVVFGAVGDLATIAPVATATAAGTPLAIDFAAPMDVVWVGTDTGLWRMTRAGMTPVTAAQGFVVRDLRTASGVVYLGTPSGVQRFDVGSQSLLSPWRAPTELLDDDVRGITVSSDGATILVATANGLSRIDRATGSATQLAAGKQALPTDDLTAVTERDGVVFLGHGVGATRIGPGATPTFDHYHSLRWIPGERVTAVALDPVTGARIVATPEGIAEIADGTDTLAARAEANHLLLDRHWRMDGFLDDDVGLTDRWAQTGFRYSDKDNDGLWTEMQIGAWCYAYATTKDERFYTAAKKAMQVMYLEVDIPALTFEAMGKSKGFITRSLVRQDEGAIFDNKAAQANWHLQSYQGQDYYWKDDTSSDEYVGHFFGLPIYYDLCAKDEAEKSEIRERMRVVTDYVIAGDYRLIDLDGEGTTFGRWYDLGIAAEGLDLCIEKYTIDRAADCIGSRHGAGWLNSVEILGQLLATWHVTGDRKYYDEYERLYTAEKYGKMINIIEDTFTVTEPKFANHSDHELAMLGYTTLLRYEPNPERRAQYVKSLLDFYEYERKEHNPWQIAVIGAYHPSEVDTDGAIDTLQKMPTDWRTWGVDNSHRKDADRWPTDRHDHPQFNRVFPYDEIRTMKWNANPYIVNDGGDGGSILMPTPYLISYWIQRYYGMLE